MVIAAAVVSGQRSQHGRHDVDRAVDGANSLCRLAETDQRDLRWVDHPEDRVNPWSPTLVMVIVRSDSSEPGTSVPRAPTWISGRISLDDSDELYTTGRGQNTRFARVLGPYLVVVTATALAHASSRTSRLLRAIGGQAVMVLMALSGGISATSAGFDETLELGGRTTAAGGR